jgi:hypothetical protein
MELTNFNSEQKFSSLFLVEQINLFRKEEGKSELAHFTLLAKIESEFEEEIGDKKILVTSYTDKSNRQSKCYELTFEESLQILMSESKTVRKRVVEVLKEQQEQIKKLQIHSYQIEDPIKRAEKWIEEQKEKQLLLVENSKLSEEVEELQIELDEHESWYSVKRVMLLGHFVGQNPNNLWRPLKNYSIQNNYRIQGIFDANYGEVKTYHKDVWKAVYGCVLK